MIKRVLLCINIYGHISVPSATIIRVLYKNANNIKNNSFYVVSVLCVSLHKEPKLRICD